MTRPGRLREALSSFSSRDTPAQLRVPAGQMIDPFPMWAGFGYGIPPGTDGLGGRRSGVETHSCGSLGLASFLAGPTRAEAGGRGLADSSRETGVLMKAKLLRDAGEIVEGTEVEIGSPAGKNDERSDEDLGGRSSGVAPVYNVTDDEGHAEKVDTRDLQRST